jgi:hypothetical protein
MSVPPVGGTADIKLLNVTCAEYDPISNDVWFRITLAPDPIDGSLTSLWLPDDSRIEIDPSVPPNWPPIAGDVWTVIGTNVDAWVGDDGTGRLYFITVANVKDKTTPMTVDAALVQFGSNLQLLTRLP